MFLRFAESSCAGSVNQFVCLEILASDWLVYCCTSQTSDPFSASELREPVAVFLSASRFADHDIKHK